MRLLLFFVSFGYSLIFYIFFLLTQGKTLFGGKINYEFILTPLSGNFIIEVIVFLFLGIIFVLFFSPLSSNSTKINKTKLIKGLLYILIFIPFIFNIFQTNNYIFLIILLFLLSTLSFDVFSDLIIFRKNKIQIRYFSLILNYIISLAGIIYLYFNGIYYYLVLLLIFGVFFNYSIYKEYKNYVSLFVSIIIVCSLVLIVFFKVKEIYYMIFI